MTDLVTNETAEACAKIIHDQIQSFSPVEERTSFDELDLSQRRMLMRAATEVVEALGARLKLDLEPLVTFYVDHIKRMTGALETIQQLCTTQDEYRERPGELIELIKRVAIAGQVSGGLVGA